MKSELFNDSEFMKEIEELGGLRSFKKDICQNFELIEEVKDLKSKLEKEKDAKAKLQVRFWDLEKLCVIC